MAWRRSEGFTLLEVLLTLALFGVAFSLITINLIRPQNVATLSSTVDTLSADIKNQQIQSMSGDSGGETDAQAHGIIFSTSSYTLFLGDTYTPGLDSNLVIDVSPATISTTLPSNTVVFQKISGEPVSYSSGQDSVTIAASDESKTITINQYGVLEVNR